MQILYFYANMREIALLSGKSYTAGTNFTQPPVVTVATNLNSADELISRFPADPFLLPLIGLIGSMTIQVKAFMIMDPTLISTKIGQPKALGLQNKDG